MNMPAVEKGIPVPPHKGGRFESPWKPFLLTLKVGDSFIVGSLKERNSILAHALRIGVKIQTRIMEKGGIRIWRIK